MNYEKIYNNIIEKAQNEGRTKQKVIRYENHHIIPKCVGGNNKKENLVLLTPREHFICHRLLMRIYPNNQKISYAFFRMSTIKSKKSTYKVSSKDYAYAKEQITLYLTSEEVKQKRKDTMFNKKFSPENVKKYFDSLKHAHYSPDFDKTIHITFKH